MKTFLLDRLAKVLPVGVSATAVFNGVLVLGVMGGGLFLYWKIYQSGKNAGYHEGNQVQLKTDDQSVQANDKSLKTDLAAETELQTQAKQRQAAANRDLAASEAELEASRNRRAANQARTASMPQAEVLPALRANLGLHPATDPAPLYPDEVRRANEVVTDYKDLKGEVATLGTQVKKLTEKVSAIEEEKKSIARQRDDALDAYNGLMGPYVKARNASMKRCGLFIRIVTVGFGCEKKIDLPDPATLAPAKKEKP